MCFLASLGTKFSFLEPYWLSETFLCVSLDFYRQDASRIWLYFEWCFLTEKVGKLVESQKFSHNRLNHSFLLSVQIAISWFNEYYEIRHFRSFLRVSNGKSEVTPLNSTKKIKLSLIGYQKIVCKDLFSFLKNLKNRQDKEFLGGRIGK